ncbi:MAG: TetR/AcrR family transcriptional regulator, partial [Gammaproteobacteria bacterium]|nr:TetR/AcrR family transcriptional regulator [Gammaproteobacteria bacterium]
NNLSLRDLASKCGVSATAIYRHYKNKEHLLAAIAQDGFNELQEAMSTTMDPNKFQKIGIAYIHFALHNPVKFQLMFTGFIEKNKYPLLHKASIDAYEILRDQVAQGIQKGLMVGNIDSLTRAAWATVHGTAMLLLDNQFAIEKHDVIDSMQIALEITRVLGQGLFAKS